MKSSLKRIAAALIDFILLIGLFFACISLYNVIIVDNKESAAKNKLV